jgi:hypothetical protein
VNRCNCGSTEGPGTVHNATCAYALCQPEPDDQIQLRPRTPLEYRAYVQGFLYGHKMTEEARCNLPTEIALETIVEGYRQMAGYPGVAREGEND